MKIAKTRQILTALLSNQPALEYNFHANGKNE